ncbi:hypothetical protein AN639_04980 [Candidatus Epulonipiscium fishelsonii]|uniref:Uncharacterized protein n=1 Tax=Candidatus Epulonipiscium fishelsonii TaxID=77094 RepID=A0ACC8XG08_9FIRM|nr:hypothetical protein AN639_04980 [Epulopiscium sp. SCG-B05WGA-EpuloA1]ONI42308.1 hypothetical protein AN396_01910 [Epulopiscium sp. SCG-B11WGA-EpuloA1]
MRIVKFLMAGVMMVMLMTPAFAQKIEDLTTITIPEENLKSIANVINYYGFWREDFKGYDVLTGFSYDKLGVFGYYIGAGYERQGEPFAQKYGLETKNGKDFVISKENFIYLFKDIFGVVPNLKTGFVLKSFEDENNPYPDTYFFDSIEIREKEVRIRSSFGGGDGGYATFRADKSIQLSEDIYQLEVNQYPLPALAEGMDLNKPMDTFIVLAKKEGANYIPLALNKEGRSYEDTDLSAYYNFLNLISNPNIIPLTQQETNAIAEVVKLINFERANVGLKPLLMDDELTRVAQIKATEMSDMDTLTHVTPLYGNPADLLNFFNIKYLNMAENIAKGPETAEIVVDSWMEVFVHAENILNSSFTHTGVGYIEDTNYWVQLFIKR